MTGDIPDIVSRLKSALPTRWFPDATPVLDAALTGLAAAWTRCSRCSPPSASNPASPPPPGLSWTAPVRISSVAGCPAAPRSWMTRSASASARRSAASTPPAPPSYPSCRISPAAPRRCSSPPGSPIPAPTRLERSATARPARWGSLALPFQVLVTAHRPRGTGIATIAGYGTAGPLVPCRPCRHQRPGHRPRHLRGHRRRDANRRHCVDPHHQLRRPLRGSPDRLSR